MTAITDSAIFGNVFSTPEMQSIWSDRQRTAYFLDFEKWLAFSQAQLGIIPPRAAEEIMKHCDLQYVDFDELRRKTELIGYPVLPLVQQLVAKVNAVEPGLGEWAHWGTTTQDLTDTAVVLQLRDSFKHYKDCLDAIIKACEVLAEKYKLTPMAARSNLQQAVPMSFGFKMARLLVTFKRHRRRLDELRSRLLVLQFSGAAGTLATITESTSYDPVAAKPGEPPLALRCQEKLADCLNLQMPEIAWHTERDNLAEAANFLALLTATCAKFATDLKLMMQTEVGEAREPYVAHRGSSSTMPQKRNPIGSAYICSMAASIRQMAAGMTEAVVADHERSTGPWEIEWIMLPQICALSHACLKQTRYLLEGLEVDENAMRRNLEISKGAIVSENVMMGLAKKGMGRQRAHDVVYEVCRRAVVEGTGLVELLEEDEEVKKVGLAREELERLCDPGSYLGLSGEMVEMVLGKWRICQDHCVSLRRPSRRLSRKRIAQPTLLTLPAEIRNKIYAFALCDPIHLTTINPSPHMRPLTRTCRQILKESLGIFLSETQLVAHIIDYDGAFVGKIYSRRLRFEAIQDSFTGPPFQQPFVDGGYLDLVMTGKPNYANLLRWARVMHRQGWQHFEAAEGAGAESKAYYAVLGTAARLKDLPWSRVEVVLEGMHVAFAALDSRWV